MSKRDFIDLVGKKYGKLTVVEYLYIKKRQRYWKCICDCEDKTEIIVNTAYLNSGKKTSCNCDSNRHNSRYDRL